MQYVPIVKQFDPTVSNSMLERMQTLADQLLVAHPEFKTTPAFEELIPDTLFEARSIHIDDYSEIDSSNAGCDITFYQHRARVRAGDGDVVLSCAEPVEGYEAYCADVLGLGRPTWLRPMSARSTLRVAASASVDRKVRKELVRLIRTQHLALLHPLMGSAAVWELALLLHESTRRPLKVIAPLPELTRWANDKVAFTEMVTQLFGDSLVPESDKAWNLSTLALKLKAMSQQCRFVGVKLPKSAGGRGNYVFDSEELRKCSSKQICDLVRKRMPKGWSQDSPLLIDAWKTDVLSSPSVQTWIPPPADGPPIIEGIFVQRLVGANGRFAGSQPAVFPQAITEEIINHGWLIARLYQELGYIGRCSFDMILVGKSFDNCELEFIECNGRWGGTSVPMTLMNRLFGDWSLHPYVAQTLEVSLQETPTFSQLLVTARDDLFDIRTGTGKLIFLNPGRLKESSKLDVITLQNLQTAGMPPSEATDQSKVNQRGADSLIIDMQN